MSLKLVDKAAAETEWDSLKPEIKRLYLEEKRKLKDVIDIMASLHNFVVT
jgi:hypothetical protein